jgi:hypothetical protein
MAALVAPHALENTFALELALKDPGSHSFHSPSKEALSSLASLIQAFPTRLWEMQSWLTPFQRRKLSFDSSCVFERSCTCPNDLDSEQLGSYFLFWASVFHSAKTKQKQCM